MVPNGCPIISIKIYDYFQKDSFINLKSKLERREINEHAYSLDILSQN